MTETVRDIAVGRLPVIAIVGRPNVGKSTLFNRIVGHRTAIVGDRPGVTVDRLETECLVGDQQVVLVDTGGIGEGTHDAMQPAIDAQVEAALEIADIVLFVTDAQAGCTPVDAAIANKLRRHQITVFLIVNKAERPNSEMDFYGLGMGDPIAISASHGNGVKEFVADLADKLPSVRDNEEEHGTPIASIAVIGRPNVGKSTLINAWLGRERMVVSDIAGTTRDAIDSELAYGDGFIRLVDTAGQRKHGRIADVIEFVARVKAVQAFKRADTAVMVLDGSEGVVEQDMRLMQLAFDEGCALIVAVNKLDLISEAEWKHYVERLDFRMRGFPEIPTFRITAKTGKGVKQLLGKAIYASKLNRFELGTGPLNRWLSDTQEAQHPPSDNGAVVRLKYASQIATSPPTIKIFCNRPKGLKSSYRKFLEQSFRQTFKLVGVPIRFIFSASSNPYAPEKKR